MNDEYLLWLDDNIKDSHDAMNNHEQHPERIVEASPGEFIRYWEQQLGTLVNCKDIYMDCQWNTTS